MAGDTNARLAMPDSLSSHDGSTLFLTMKTLLSQLQQGPVPSSSGGAFPGYDYLVSHQQIDLDRIQRQNRFAQSMAQGAQAFFCD